MNQNNQIVGYNPQTGQPIYANGGLNTFNNQNIEYANFGKRLGAYLLDSLLVFGISILLFIFFTILNFVLAILGVELSILGLSYFITFLLIFFGQPVYCVIAENGKKKNTWGKRKMGIIVKNVDDTPISLGKSFVRCLLKFIIPYGYFISMITILASGKKQALHDMILNQVVVVLK